MSIKLVKGNVLVQILIVFMSFIQVVIGMVGTLSTLLYASLNETT